MDPRLNVASFLCGLVFVNAVGYNFNDIDPTSVQTGLMASAACFESILGPGQGGFSPDCAYLWASNAANTHFSGCTQDCVTYLGACIPDPANPFTPPSKECIDAALMVFLPNPDQCVLNDCLFCDEENSGVEFQAFGGRTRRNSGIITSVQQEIEINAGMPGLPNPVNVLVWSVLKRPCAGIANLLHDPCAV